MIVLADTVDDAKTVSTTSVVCLWTIEHCYLGAKRKPCARSNPNDVL
jgi:hypothetical protein